MCNHSFDLSEIRVGLTQIFVGVSIYHILNNSSGINQREENCLGVEILCFVDSLLLYLQGDFIIGVDNL